MVLKALEYLLRSENRSRLYLVRKCWPKGQRFCIRCGERKIYRLVKSRYRCARCRYTFQDFSGRWIGELNLSAKQWLWILKLFELEISARRIAQEAAISYPTTLKATHLIRCAIAQQSPDFDRLREEIDLAQTVGGRKKAGRRETPVFGLSMRNGRVEVTVVTDLCLETLLDENVKAVKTGPIVYTDRFANYDAVVFGGYHRINVDDANRLTRGKVYINGLEGFWSFAKERLTKFHGVSKQYFPLYLKEMEFRYNHRHEQLFDLLADYSTRLVPNISQSQKSQP